MVRCRNGATGTGPDLNIETQSIFKESLRPQVLLFKNDRFLCTDSHKKTFKHISSP